MCSPRQNLKTVFLIAQLLLPSVAWSWTGTTDSTGFTVDTSSRNDVLSFWQGVYLKSEGYEKRVGWTGSYSSLALGAEGSTSAAFVTDVERRTNFIRALCGVPADARFNTGATVNIFPGDSYSPAATTTKFAAAQRSALMIIKTARDHPTDGHSGDGLSHDPPTTCTAWTSASWNANSKSNLAYAFYGPAAVDAYFREDVPGVSAWNIDLGHRRWLLALQSTNFATGDTPGQRPVNATDRGIPPSNCLYVIPKTSELATTASARFVAYPAPGFFPAPLNSPYWSLSYPGANFNAASVTVTASDNSNVPTTLVSKRVGFGENAIVWQVPASVAVRAISADVTYRVAVTGIAGAGIPTSYSYSVTLINPSQLTDLPVVSGSSSPSTVGESYRFTRANLADSMEVGFFRPLDIGWVEGAEDSPSPAVVDLTDASYALRVSTPGFFRSGNKSFRLSLPTTYEPTLGGVPDQIFEFTREILPAASATLNLYYRRGFMAAGTRLLVETSDDGGVSWTIRSTVLGTASNAADPSFSALAVPLPVSTVPLRARFRLTYTSGALYTIVGQPTLTTGIYLDDISTTNCLSLEKRGSIESVAPTTSINFNSTTAGEALADGQTWWLRLRSQFGGAWFPYGPPKIVMPTGPLTVPLLPTGLAAPPDTGATYDFLPDPTASGYQLDISKMVAGSWSEGAEASPTPKILDQTGAYALISTKVKKTGKNAFRLALDGDSDSFDAFEIDRDIIPKSGSALTFQVKRGRMLNTNFIHAEVSADGGSTWTSLWSLPGLAVSSASSTSDRAFTLQTISLSSYIGREIRLRFAFRKNSAALTIAAASKTDVGAWFDDISVSNANFVESRVRTNLAATATSFVLDSTSASPGLIAGSTYRLRLRAIVSGVPGPWGSVLSVVPVFSVPIVNWTEGAEASPAPQVNDLTGSYDLLSKAYFKTGSRSFRLALDSATDSSDSFEIDRTIIPTPGSRLTFQTRRGRMLNSNALYAEISQNSGTTWTPVWNQNGLATSLTATTADKTFTAQSVSLASYATKNIRVRFIFRNSSPGSTITSVSRADAGVWIDDISVSFSGVGSSPALLAVRASPPISDYAAWEIQYPEMVGQPFDADTDGDGTPNGIEFAFSLDPLVRQATSDTVERDLQAGLLKMTRPLPTVRKGITYGAEWTDTFTTWSTSGITVTTTGGQATASAPIGNGKRFIRWKISKP